MSMLPSTSLRIFFLICVFRILNTFLIHSYFDPDEAWQTMEPAYCAVFRPDQGFDCPGFTWEWKRRSVSSQQVAPALQFGSKVFEASLRLIETSLQGPARTYLSVAPVHFFFESLRMLHLDSTWMVARGPMILYAVTVAAPTDWAVWYCAQILYTTSEASVPSSLPLWCLLASLSAWFNAFSMVRTFANAQEAMLLMISIVLVSDELLATTSKRQTRRHRMWRARAAFLLGGMSVSIRGTSVAAFVPMGILLALQEKSWSRSVSYLFSTCAFFGLLGIGVAVLVDYWFFGFVTMPFLGNFHFNVILDHASLFGSHPWHWYFTAGVPAIAGILLPFLMADWLPRSNVQWTKGRRNLWIIAVTYIVAMSMNDHKEFRYILPLLPVFCLLAGERLQTLLGSHQHVLLRVVGLAVMVVGNFLAILYLGMFHQSGSISVNREILRVATQHVNIEQPQLRESPQLDTHLVAYMTGSCHSTPLLSALHHPSVYFETRMLDCSPSCRADAAATCETEQFHGDPLGFLRKEYPIECTNEESLNDKSPNGNPTCQWDDKIALPSFLVTMSSYVDGIRDFILGMGLYETGRFPHHLTGAQIAGYTFGEDCAHTSNRCIHLGGNFDVVVEDVVLFSRATNPTIK